VDDKTQRNLKLAIVLGLIGAIGYFVLPILAKMALDLVTIIAVAGGLFGLWMFLPAISEALAQLSYRLWELAIRTDPIAKLNRELEKHAQQIRDMETRIAQANSGVLNFEKLLRDEAGNLTVDEKSDWQSQIDMLKQASKELVLSRNQAIEDHQKFRLDVKKAEAQLKIGNAFKSVLGAFAFSGNKGAGSAGARAALDAVQQRLNTSQAGLQLVLSRQLAIPKVQPAQLSAR
jgi:hypothetical protein